MQNFTTLCEGRWENTSLMFVFDPLKGSRQKKLFFIGSAINRGGGGGGKGWPLRKKCFFYHLKIKKNILLIDNLSIYGHITFKFRRPLNSGRSGFPDCHLRIRQPKLYPSWNYRKRLS